MRIPIYCNIIVLFILLTGCSLYNDIQFRDDFVNKLNESNNANEILNLSEIYPEPWNYVIIASTGESLPFDTSCNIYKEAFGFNLDALGIDQIGFTFVLDNRPIRRLSWDTSYTKTNILLKQCLRNHNLPYRVSVFNRSEALFRIKGDWATPNCKTGDNILQYGSKLGGFCSLG